jgi:hypothetical protein
MLIDPEVQGENNIEMGARNIGLGYGLFICLRQIVGGLKTDTIK